MPEANIVHVGDVIETQQSSWFQRNLIFWIAITMVIEGNDNQVVGFAAPLMTALDRFRLGVRHRPHRVDSRTGHRRRAVGLSLPTQYLFFFATIPVLCAAAALFFLGRIAGRFPEDGG
jgi:hypothetical protein